MKKIVSLVLAAAMTSALAGCSSSAPATTAAPAETTAAAAETTAAAAADTAAPAAEGDTRETYLTFKIGGSHNAESFFAQGLFEFERLVEENTKGAIQVEVFNDSALGSEGEMAEGVAMGTVDACLVGSSSVAKLDSRFNVFSLPYLFTDNKHVDAVFAGAPGQEMADEIWNNTHVKLLDYWDSGFRHYSNSKHPINGPEDMAGLLIRIPDNPIQAATAKALGASTSTLAYKEVYLACSNGTVDGCENPIFAIIDDNFNEVQKYLVLDGHIYTVMGVLMNGDVWEKIEPADQEIIIQAAKDAGIVEKEGIRNNEKDQIEYLKEQGMESNENPDKEAWRQAVAGVYDEFKDTYGAEYIDSIKNFQY